MEYIDLTVYQDAAYKLAELISKSSYNNVLLYEIHEGVDANAIWNCEEGHEHFRAKSQELYNVFINSHYVVDDYPATISVALKIGDQWFVCEDCGSNYYLGYGPTGILTLREACLKRGIYIIAIEASIKDWLSKNFPKRDMPQKRNLGESKQFEKIIKQLKHFAIEMQRRKGEYQNLNEENIRNRMLPLFNTIFKGRCNGEALNVDGKTDILIRTPDGLNEHIFELKVWRGIETFKEALGQLQGYLHYNNNNAGIIMFCLNDNFTNIDVEVGKYLEQMYPVIPIVREVNDYRFKLNYPTDDYKLINTHVFLINLK